MNIPQTSYPRVLIIGGGFAGLAVARGLENQELQVVLIDKHNYHTFQPLLYQVATGGLEPDSIAFPLRKRFNDVENFYFRLAEVLKIDPETCTVETTKGTQFSLNTIYLRFQLGIRQTLLMFFCILSGGGCFTGSKRFLDFESKQLKVGLLFLKRNREVLLFFEHYILL